MTDVITGVALRSPEGLVVALPRPARHYQLYALMALVNPNADFDEAIQGFMTRFGVFVSRKAAFQLVQTNGQPNRRSGSPDSTELYSEDVW